MPEKGETRYRIPDSERYFQESERPIQYEQLKELNILPA